MKDGIAMPDLRSSILLIHQELSELRKLVESCVEWQTKLERSIKEEFSSAVKQLGEIGKCSPGTKWMPGKRDACYICSEAPVDAVLYRCGHMCTCFNCAQDLQWSSGRCPICYSMIIDVVRAYPNS
ncbi:hypothetical protein HPP92_017572 [Vanilla planifolia]|uniref:RING-type domain-containing protein n=1 Tax=Vanilla planifolia TaxID=51239 RepID=A0A835UR30_VANPL|nr:hypothetical protein HPP92_017572 [Vanilla planifolia]